MATTRAAERRHAGGRRRIAGEVGPPAATDEDLWHALEVAQARDFVEDMPEQLDAPIAQGGTNVSGGQRQRLSIARALVPDPAVLVADEPASALDVTTRIEVIDLLARLRRERQLSIVMVSHDMSVVAALCDTTLVLKDGTVIETGETMSILNDPHEAYTRQLISAIPRLPAPPASGP